jgi:DNA-binding transcriptional ArsR family regulator
MKRSRALQGFVISDVRQIRTLSSPIRQDILDAVTAIGPCSVSELAAAIGRRPDSLYYHVRRLVKVGLIREEPDGGAGRGELRLDVPHNRFYLEYKPESRPNKTAVLRVAAAMVRSAERGFRRAFDPDVAVVAGPGRNLWASRTRGALTPADLAEVNALIARLHTIMRSGRRDRGPSVAGDRSLHELTVILAPHPTSAKR